MKAINFDTDEVVDVVPFGLFSPDFSSLYLEDANTGYPMAWLYTADASHRGRVARPPRRTQVGRRDHRRGLQRGRGRVGGGDERRP